MLKRISQDTLFPFLLLLLFILFFIIVYFAEATFDSGDGLGHYFISRYSWKHPALFLDQWGKPLFTLLSSPFSQFGLIGMNVFQIICALATSFFCYRIAKKLELQFAWMLPVFICFSPIYFGVINSGLTEPLFGCMLMLSVLLFFQNKYSAGAITASFLSFVRAEATFVLPLIVLFLILKRKWVALLLLSTGYILYSLIGFLYYKDILWLLNQNPYHTDTGMYGNPEGPLLHYVKEYNSIFGKPLGILLVIGIVFSFLQFFFKEKKKEIRGSSEFLTHEIFLIHGTFWACFLAHTILWGMGIFPTLGLLRYMTTLIPEAALISLMGFNLLIFPFRRRQKLQVILSIVFSGWIVIFPFKQDFFPFRLHPEQPIIQSAADWINQSEYKNEKIYFLHPYFPFVLDVDPYDNEKVCQLWGLYASIKESGIGLLPEKTLVVWDAHYAANDGELPLDSIRKDTNFRLLKVFKPNEEFNVLGGHPFAVYVFSRERSSQASRSSETFDFEENGKLANEHPISEERSSSGKFSCKLSNTIEFSPAIVKDLGDINGLNQLNVRAKILLMEKLSEAFFVMQITDSSGNSLLWEGKELKMEQSAGNEWEIFETTLFPSSELIVPGNKMKLYFWNKGKKTFFVDDIQITYKGI